MKNKKLYPNCSEIVWRLEIDRTTKEKIIKSLEDKDNNKGGYETSTNTYPNDCVNDMITLLEEAKEDGKDIENIELEYVENSGGGGDWDYVEECFEIAKKYMEKKITRDEANKLEEMKWNE